MNKERQTKFNNQIIYNLLKDYSVVDIKILSMLVNRLITKHKAIENENENSDKEDFLEIGISLDFFKEYKGKSKLSIKEISEIMKKIISFGVQLHENETYKRISVISEVEYNEKNKNFTIYFNENSIEYLILVYKKFTLIDLEIVKNFSSKYELGLYILIQMYKDTGLVIKKTDDLRKYFNIKSEPKILFNNIRKAATKLNNDYNYKINFEYKKTGKRIDLIEIKFKKQLRLNFKNSKEMIPCGKSQEEL